MMLLSLRTRIVVLSGLMLLLICTLFAVWHQQQAQVMIEAPAQSPQLQCVSYAPYYKPDMNPTYAGMYVRPEQIDSDLKALSKVTGCVRTYATAQGLEYVPKAAKALGMQVMLGVWIGWLDADNKDQLSKAVALANEYPETVKSLVVGNEVLLRGEQSEAAMRGYLQWAQSHTNAPVTYADVWEFWLKHPGLEQEVDFITVHILPYWEDMPVAVAQGVMHTAAIMDKLAFAFKKPLFIGETGWPSQGRQRFWSTPGVVNQARYVREFLREAAQRGWQYNLIEAVDQPWKRGLEGTVGGYWGLFDTSLHPKFSFQGGVAERQDGILPYALTVLCALTAWLVLSYRGASRFTRVLCCLVAANVGLHGYLQLEYVGLAARTGIEWLMLIGLSALGWLLVFLQVRAWLGKPKHGRLEQNALLLFALALFLTSASLAVDGRYRNFPLILVGLPLLINALGVCSMPVLNLKPAAHVRAVWLLAVLTVFACNLAISVAMPETGNLTAWWWAGVCGLATVILPLKTVLKT